MNARVPKVGATLRIACMISISTSNGEKKSTHKGEMSGENSTRDRGYSVPGSGSGDLDVSGQFTPDWCSGEE